MKVTRRHALPFLLAVVIGMAFTAPSEARKKIPPTGCNMQQMNANDPKLRACYAKQDDDWIKGRSYIHVVACVSGHRYCCVQQHSNGSYSHCEQIDLVGPGSGTTNPAEPPVDPGPRRYNGPASSQRPTTATPN